MQVDSLIIFAHGKGNNYFSIKAIILFLLFKFQFAHLFVQKNIYLTSPLFLAYYGGCMLSKENKRKWITKSRSDGDQISKDNANSKIRSRMAGELWLLQSDWSGKGLA